MAGSLTISGLEAGLLTGQKTIGPITMTGSSVIGQITDLPLVAGDNTITVPSGSSEILIVLPATNTVELKIRTNLNSGDAGMPLGPTGFVTWPIFTGTTSVIVNAASTTGMIEATFI